MLEVMFGGSVEGLNNLFVPSDVGFCAAEDVDVVGVDVCAY